MDLPINPLLIPLVGTIAMLLAAVAIVGIIVWFKARDKEMQYHQEMRKREMEHQLKMKELEVELERIKARSFSGQVA
jgi:predicted Holliday junction resolvase-like endonuclease